MHIPSHSILSKTQSWFFIVHPSNAEEPSTPYNPKFPHSFVAGISLGVYFWILFVIQETSLWGLQLRKFHSFLCHPHTVPPPTYAYTLMLLLIAVSNLLQVSWLVSNRAILCMQRKMWAESLLCGGGDLWPTLAAEKRFLFRDA